MGFKNKPKIGTLAYAPKVGMGVLITKSKTDNFTLIERAVVLDLMHWPPCVHTPVVHFAACFQCCMNGRSWANLSVRRHGCLHIGNHPRVALKLVPCFGNPAAAQTLRHASVPTGMGLKFGTQNGDQTNLQNYVADVAGAPSTATKGGGLGPPAPRLKNMLELKTDEHKKAEGGPRRHTRLHASFAFCRSLGGRYINAGSCKTLPSVWTGASERLGTLALPLERAAFHSAYFPGRPLTRTAIAVL